MLNVATVQVGTKRCILTAKVLLSSDHYHTRLMGFASVTNQGSDMGHRSSHNMQISLYSDFPL